MSRLAYKDLPACRRCSRLAETCAFYDPAGCMGCTRPAEARVISEAERAYWSALNRLLPQGAGGGR